MSTHLKKMAAQAVGLSVRLIVALGAIMLMLSVLPEDNGKACDIEPERCYSGENVPQG